jgi:hypothetical protein
MRGTDGSQRVQTLKTVITDLGGGVGCELDELGHEVVE